MRSSADSPGGGPSRGRGALGGGSGGGVVARARVASSTNRSCSSGESNARSGITCIRPGLRTRTVSPPPRKRFVISDHSTVDLLRRVCTENEDASRRRTRSNPISVEPGSGSAPGPSACRTSLQHRWWANRAAGVFCAVMVILRLVTTEDDVPRADICVPRRRAHPVCCLASAMRSLIRQ